MFSNRYLTQQVILLIVGVTTDTQEGLSLQSPLSFFFSHPSANTNADLYRLMTTTLSQRVKARLQHDPAHRSSGCIINTPAWSDGPAYDLLLHCITAFGVKVVLVMGDDRLTSRLTEETIELAPGITGSGGGTGALRGLGVTVVKLQKSGGVVSRVSWIP